LKNIFTIRIKLFEQSLLIFQIKGDKLGIFSIYGNNRKNILSESIPYIENLAQFQSKGTWIWFNNPLIWDDIKNVKGCKYYFDTVELYFSVVEYRHHEASLTRIYRDIVKNIHLLTTISNSGLKYFKNLNPKLPMYLVRNGVNLNLFKPPDNSRNNEKQKVVGLIGNLNDNHDYSGLLKAAKELKNIRFIIVGKVHGGSKSLDELTRNNLDKLFILPNVEHYEWVPLIDLPSLISTFDAGLITYRTKKHNPDNLLNTGDSLKKYQYLACNVPVISSDCQEVDKKIQEGVYTYYEEKEVKSVIERVVNNKKMNYRSLVINSDWNLIIKRILSHVEKI
jgi:glycosyltransferase involved in cell wall biosynthesis